MALSLPTAPLTRLGLLLAGRGMVAGARMREALAGAGLSMRSAFTLMHLAGGPVNQQALIELLDVDPSALVAVLNELEGLGLASRQRDTADRRRHIVTLTDEGARTLRAIDAIMDKAEEDLFAALSPAEREQLRGLLTKVADAGTYGEEC